MIGGSKGLDVQRIDVFDGLASDFAGVIFHSKEIKKVFFVIPKTGPQDEHVSLFNDTGTFVFEIVDVNNFLTKLLLNQILFGQRS